MSIDHDKLTGVMTGVSGEGRTVRRPVGESRQLVGLPLEACCTLQVDMVGWILLVRKAGWSRSSIPSRYFREPLCLFALLVRPLEVVAEERRAWDRDMAGRVQKPAPSQRVAGAASDPLEGNSTEAEDKAEDIKPVAAAKGVAERAARILLALVSERVEFRQMPD